MPECAERRFKFIGCEILYREACYLAATGPHRVDVQFLRKALHNLQTPDMVSAVQAAVDAVDPEADYEAILLGYARCNDGLVGVTARQIPLVIPRAHDCITLFFGSRKAYREYFDEHPGTYYLSTGWSERDSSGTDGLTDQLGPGVQGVMEALGLHESYEQLVARHGKENADFIVESLGDWRRNYSRLLYLKMGCGDEDRFIEQARAEAKQHDWDFELRDGDWTLLEKLFFGKWDDDFVIVPPEGHIVARNDEAVLDVES